MIIRLKKYMTIGLLLCIMAAAGYSCGAGTESDAVVVNGYGVPAEEWALIAQQYRSKALAGEDPAPYTLETAVHHKVLEIWAQREGIANGIGYTYILKLLQAENDKRAAAMAAGRTVYGPVQFTVREYYDLYYGNLEAELVKQLLKQSVYGSGLEGKRRAEDSLRARVAQLVKEARIEIKTGK